MLPNACSDAMHALSEPFCEVWRRMGQMLQVSILSPSSSAVNIIRNLLLYCNSDLIQAWRVGPLGVAL